MIKILLIEDDVKKIRDIKDFLQVTFEFNKLEVKESYQSGMRALMNQDFDLLLLDMSIPTWDKSLTESGGNYQKFGGYKILKEIVRKGKPINTILITMFDDFGESDTSITLNQLEEILKNEFSNLYKGRVFYSTSETKWKDELKLLVERLLK